MDSTARYDIPTKEEPHACKITATVFWHHQGVILVNLVPGRTTVNSDRYIGILSILYTPLFRAISGRNMSKMMILHDIPKPYQSRHI